MLGLTSLGLVHTAISLVAVVAGAIALFRYRRIAWATLAGKVYIATTALTCTTGFGIFQHGGFGKPHALGIRSARLSFRAPKRRSCRWPRARSSSSSSWERRCRCCSYAPIRPRRSKTSCLQLSTGVRAGSERGLTPV